MHSAPFINRIVSRFHMFVRLATRHQPLTLSVVTFIVCAGIIGSVLAVRTHLDASLSTKNTPTHEARDNTPADDDIAQDIDASRRQQAATPPSDSSSQTGTASPGSSPAAPTAGGGVSPKASSFGGSTGASGGSASSGTTSTPKNSASTPSTTPTPQPTTPATPACGSGFTGTYPNCVPAPIGVGGTWNLAMRDEFDGTSLGAQWATQRGPSWSYGDPYNASLEDAFYIPNNPKVQNGNLILTLNQGATNGYPYSSGMVQNGRSWNYKYGYVEARVKVPGNTGVWPAFWTLPAPVDSTWPPEIDIFEFGLSSQTRPSFNYHYGTSSNHQQSGLTVYGNANTNYTQDFHTYGMLWTPTKIQVYLDGQPGPSYTSAGNITATPQYIIFNLALKKGYSVPSGTAMYVDYVRVWQ